MLVTKELSHTADFPAFGGANTGPLSTISTAAPMLNWEWMDQMKDMDGWMDRLMDMEIDPVIYSDYLSCSKIFLMT
ncbi:uncharacterized protein J3R85_003461 [Psidium guajava]|nr:uncharacterized protein J3R85_003461 [Psidium guajava]